MKTVIDNRNPSLTKTLKEIVQYKELLFTLSWRDFKVRYAQTFLGITWAFIQPLFTSLILSVVFGQIAGVETKVPHFLFTLSGMALWSYFSSVVSSSGSSLISNQNLVKKVYFPRLIIPISRSFVGLIDLGIVMVMLVVFLAFYQILPSANIYLIPFYISFGLLSALGVGIWLSALTIKYRDFQHVVPFLTQVLLYLTPIAYPSSIVIERLPKWASIIYYLNPMTGVIEGFRWTLFGGDAPSNYIYLSFLMVILVLISGLFYFKKIESSIADLI